jgi:hypothetical protein
MHNSLSAPAVEGLSLEPDARHGDPERWLLTHGVQPREIERFRETMLTTDSPPLPQPQNDV